MRLADLDEASIWNFFFLCEGGGSDLEERPSGQPTGEEGSQPKGAATSSSLEHELE